MQPRILLVGGCLTLCACSGKDERLAAGGEGSAGSAGVAGATGAAGEAGAAGEPAAYVAPGEPGPFPVGVTTTVQVDDSRDEPLTPDEGDVRTLVTEIWYPASEAAREQPKDPFKGFLGPDADTLIPLIAAQLGGDPAQAAEIGEMETGSVRDADASEAGPFPVVLFSHGNTGVRFQSMFLMEHLASRGFVVVAPDHTGNAAITQLPSGTVFYNPGSVLKPELRVGDMSFLLDRLPELDAEAGGRFEGRLDLDHVGVSGHSFGGYTTVEAVRGDERFDAGAPLMGTSPGATGIDRPMLFMLATEDATIGADGNADIGATYAASAGARWLLRAIDAGHFSVTEICRMAPDYGDGCGSGERLADATPFDFVDWHVVHDITRFYEAALFGYYLQRVEGYAEDLQQSSFDPLELEHAGFP